MEDKEITGPANVSLYKKSIDFIDKHRIGHGFRSRSHYIQWLVNRDIHYNKIEMFAEVTGAMVLPMMGFFFFMLLSVLTHGLLFYIFMGVFGIFAVLLSMIYYNKRKPIKQKDGRLYK